MKFDPRQRGALCDKCPRREQKPVPPEGRAGARAAWLGQDPGQNEVAMGRPFVGATGKRLTSVWAAMCERLGLDWPRSAIWITNACLCLPVKQSNEREAKLAADCCRPRLVKELRQLAPDAGILVMGKWAWYALTGRTKGKAKFDGFHVRVKSSKLSALAVANEPKKAAVIAEVPF